VQIVRKSTSKNGSVPKLNAAKFCVSHKRALGKFGKVLSFSRIRRAYVRCIIWQ